MQRKSQPEFHYLYSSSSFEYCDLLLGLGKWEEVLERSRESLKLSTYSNWLLSIALDQLSIARGHSQAAESATSTNNHEFAARYYDLAVKGLQKAGTLDMLPKGLLARAHWHLQTNRLDLAAQDLAEALEIAEGGKHGAVPRGLPHRHGPPAAAGGAARGDRAAQGRGVAAHRGDGV
ncbi:MAG: hypothetical protein IPM82_08245 [Saprospiraceae bacterium]|nr:hypothetical protein [Saprospiraceae bacterium]